MVVGALFALTDGRTADVPSPILQANTSLALDRVDEQATGQAADVPSPTALLVMRAVATGLAGSLSTVHTCKHARARAHTRVQVSSFINECNALKASSLWRAQRYAIATVVTGLAAALGSIAVAKTAIQ